MKISYRKYLWLRFLYLLPLPDREWFCPLDCGTFVFDKIPWPCGKCGELMVRRWL